MQKIAEHLYVSQCHECSQLTADNYARIYCCHWPCEQSRKPRNGAGTCIGQKILPNEIPQTLFFLELENMEIPRYQVSDFNQHLDLVDRLLKRYDVIISSENAESRAPSLALLWMSFRGQLISRSSFAAARADFTRIYPRYTPWPGWVIFFEQEWDAFK